MGLEVPGRGCLAGLSYCRIDPTGEVTPCPYLPLALGNVLERPFSEIWHGSPVLAALRDPGRTLGGRCGRCAFRVACGGCRARAFGAARPGAGCGAAGHRVRRPGLLPGRGPGVRARARRGGAVSPTVALDRTDRLLLQELQDAFPLDGRPWKVLGDRLGLSEDEVLDRVQRLSREGVVRNVGPVVEARRVGLPASTLVAMRVPESRLLEVARMVGEHPGVSHCYERDHAYNLWFTLAMEDEASMAREVRRLRLRARLPETELLDLPVTRRFKVDVRYRFTDGGGRA